MTDRPSTGTNQWALKTVFYPDTTLSITDNPRTVYEYLDNVYRHFLVTTVSNRPSPQPSTWSTTKWTYDVKKRVTSVERSVGQELWQYQYDDQNSSVKIANSLSVTNVYSRRQGADGLWQLFKLLGDGKEERQECQVIRKCFLEAEFPSPHGVFVCYYRCNSGTREIRQMTRCPRVIDDAYPG